MTKKSPLINQPGITVGVIGASVDITREKQAEIAKQEFMASMSHDIRTPFSGLYSFVELLHAQEEDTEKKEMLGYVLESAETLLKFLNQILEITRLENSSVRKTEFNLYELIHEIVKLMKPSSELKSIALRVDCPNEKIKTDKTRFECILLNLLGNAVKFTHQGSITIRAKTQPTLCIEVEDTGIGIPDDQFESIFDKFYRLLPTYKDSKFTGIGMGLYISRFLARELNGDITLKSQLGTGSCFTLSIPMT
jgi:two-component system aerobic respiration control sensor histidine kinase ArcB